VRSLLVRSFRADVPNRYEVMEAYLLKFRERYGSVERYLVERCGVTQEEVDTIKSRLQ
jgi:hypothetical protein